MAGYRLKAGMTGEGNADHDYGRAVSGLRVANELTPAAAPALSIGGCAFPA
ncbi:hypothetical protein AGR4C_Lc120062 [Agrobacterium tumefaciens str. Kerr 14]|uniref:Uncharacterized protein n=1 Tax=Agrobacterium tumefaciens str. Kerr 14 TaxID=1183424 RepID=A0A1S7R7N5_AGRTU|nr:hypothetical protein AGR4C_Lc120062 [Agrobacterium tumefaciens str. Kerr 14]